MTPYNYTLRKIRAFTLIEVMVVMAISVSMAAFAMVSYSTSVNRAKVNDAIGQLMVLNAANTFYYGRTGSFYPGTSLTMAQINTGLNINLIANGLTYSYTRDLTTGVLAYSATAAYGSTFTVKVLQNITTSTTTQCCFAGNCYSVVPAC